MRIFVAGASGALGKRLVPLLVGKGHQVTGTTRSEAKAEAIRAQGAEAAIADGLDGEAMRAAVAAAAPDVIVHQMTALDREFDIRKLEEVFELTNRLRSEGTDHLLAAARAAGVRRFVAQSFAGWPYAPVGGPVKTEDDPLNPDPPKQIRTTLDAIKHAEHAVTTAAGIDGIVLRYGGFYGPGTGMDRGGSQVEEIRARRVPIIGKGAGVWSFVHIDDAAAATLAAVERGAPGIYNVADDEPAPVREWLPAIAEMAGAKPPRHIPAWLARILVGEHALTMMETSRGAANAKAKRELGWQPGWPSWREGVRAALAP
jgi:nucleoside-diphosphate-sugar epimerase